MQALLKEVYREVDNVHKFVCERIETINGSILKQTDLRELVDLAYALREIAKLADDVRKMAESNKRVAEQVCCARAIEAGPDSLTRIKTNYASGEPDVKMMASLPKKDTAEFQTMMDFLGVPKELSSGPLPPVRADFRGMTEYLTNRAAEGLPLPPGIHPDKTYPLYQIKNLRKLKGVLHYEDD